MARVVAPSAPPRLAERPEATHPAFQIAKAKEGGFYFQVVAAGGGVLLRGEKQATRVSARNAIAAVRKSVIEQQGFEVQRRKGMFAFVLKAANREVIARGGSSYASESSCKRALSEVVSAAVQAASPESKGAAGTEMDAAILERAVEVIGDRDDAYRWLGTPVRALGFATPVSLLGTQRGRSAVLDVLGRIEHGVL